MKGFMQKKSENEHTHSASFYRPDFGIGDSVFVWGTVHEIQIAADGVWYTVLLDNTKSARTITIHGADVFPIGLKTNGGEGIE